MKSDDGASKKNEDVSRRPPARDRRRADRRRLERKKGRVSNGGQKCNREETTGTVKVTDGHVTSVTFLEG
ncbi:hypothetical protein LINPERPRIM_LOCUS29154 [Linum perenne]